MKTKEIVANIKVEDELGKVISVIEAKGSYSEPESIEEFMSMNGISQEDKLRVIQYGLNTIKGGELRAQNNFGPVAKKLVEAKLFKSYKEAFEHLMALKNSVSGNK